MTPVNMCVMFAKKSANDLGLKWAKILLEIFSLLLAMLVLTSLRSEQNL